MQLRRLFNKNVCKFFLVFIFLFQIGLISCQTPYKYWTFDHPDFITDDISKSKIDTSTFKVSLGNVQGIRGNAIDLSANGLNTTVTRALTSSAGITDQLTINFFFKGSKIRYQTISIPHLLFIFNYSYIQFNTTSLVGNKNVLDTWIIQLTGTGKNSYNYYTDGNWHMLSFVIDNKKGKKYIYVDGELPEGFSKDIPKNSKIVLHSSDGFRATDQIDELSYFNKALSPSEVKKLFNSVVKNSDRKQNNEILTRSPSLAAEEESININGLDVKDFAPGYPDYTVQVTEQMEKFPAPRFKSQHNLSRNFPWLDITYFHRELPGNGGAGIGKTDPHRAVKLSRLLYDKWNYYFEIPVLRNEQKVLDQQYSSTNSVSSALINYAKNNKDLKTAAVIMQIQGKPVNAGFESAKPFISSQNLDDKYYLKDSKGNPVIHSRKKWLSPLAPLDYIYKDAKTSAFYLKEVEKHLGRPIDFLNENGEFFGHIWSFDLLEKDPSVAKDIKKKNWDVFKYNGWFQQKLDTAYKNEILRSLNWKNTRYTLYNVTAMQPNYWPDYSMRRQTNDIRNGIHYSTPNFYPARPENWRQNAGTYNGYGQIADGRKREIALGDKLFAPFVSAGWRFEEENIRPAQWLALLKSMVMLGAEYFHVGYFNITGSKGWPNGKGPFDPRGYAYQAAMPVYAQAIGSHVFDFITNGTLLNPQPEANSIIYSYRFKASQENHLVMVRKLNNQYLIYGSIQPNSNYVGNVPDEANTKIELEGKEIQFKIRRQGSMFVYIPGTNPKIIQLDEWHQKEHPYYWNEENEYEAEIAAEALGSPNVIRTEGNGIGFNDFSVFKSYISVQGNQRYSYHVAPGKNRKIILNLKAEKNAVLKISFAKAGEKEIKVNKNAWNNYEIDLPAGSSEEINITVTAAEGTIDFDKFIIR